MTATILRIPNEDHMAKVRVARREAGLWVPPGFRFSPATPAASSAASSPMIVGVDRGNGDSVR